MARRNSSHNPVDARSEQLPGQPRKKGEAIHPDAVPILQGRKNLLIHSRSAMAEAAQDALRQLAETEAVITAQAEAAAASQHDRGDYANVVVDEARHTQTERQDYATTVTSRDQSATARPIDPDRSRDLLQTDALRAVAEAHGQEPLIASAAAAEARQATPNIQTSAIQPQSVDQDAAMREMERLARQQARSLQDQMDAQRAEHPSSDQNVAEIYRRQAPSQPGGIAA